MGASRQQLSAGRNDVNDADLYATLVPQSDPRLDGMVFALGLRKGGTNVVLLFGAQRWYPQQGRQSSRFLASSEKSSVATRGRSSSSTRRQCGGIE